mmetsp:Transcript_4961/g.9350  ORF Transcript_4961/g.9350 Transcript_4961/m.9350 type:complete len:208 (-) Transcript_4961:288-911(-)
MLRLIAATHEEASSSVFALNWSVSRNVSTSKQYLSPASFSGGILFTLHCVSAIFLTSSGCNAIKQWTRSLRRSAQNLRCHSRGLAALRWNKYPDLSVFPNEYCALCRGDVGAEPAAFLPGTTVPDFTKSSNASISLSVRHARRSAASTSAGSSSTWCSCSNFLLPSRRRCCHAVMAVTVASSPGISLVSTRTTRLIFAVRSHHAPTA